MGQLLAGPFCGQLLADFGAEVIKLEDPARGDPMRQWGREKPHGLSLWWPVIARNKKSVTLNLRDPEGQALARRLLGTADVLVENFGPGPWSGGARLRRAGRAEPGAGAGPGDRVRPGRAVRAPGGLRLHRRGHGRAALCHRRPLDPAEPLRHLDRRLLAGTFAALGTLLALHARARTGRGQVVDSAIYEAVLAMTESLVTEYQVAGYTRERTGPSCPTSPPPASTRPPTASWCWSPPTRTPCSGAWPR